MASRFIAVLVALLTLTWAGEASAQHARARGGKAVACVADGVAASAATTDPNGKVRVRCKPKASPAEKPAKKPSAAPKSKPAKPRQSASGFKGYYYGARNLEEIAVLIERSVARDPSGKSLIAPEKCAHDGSCGTPAAYLASFQAHNPEAGLTSVKQLAHFIRTRLVKDCSIVGTFEMDRIVLSKNGSVRADISGMKRALRKGECAYVDRITGRIVMAPHCANPIGLATGPCAIIEVPSDALIEHVAVADADDQCLAWRDAPSGARDDGRGWQWYKACRFCDFSQFRRATSMPAVPLGHTPLGRGHRQFRVNRNNLLHLCFEHEGRPGHMSYVVTVRPQDLTLRSTGDYRAFVGPQFVRFPN